MAPASICISISTPQTAGYKPLSPYTDDAPLSNNLLCPRYAESDASSAPPSPTSIESFDVLDSIAWRRGYTTYGAQDVRTRTCDVLRKRWRKSRGPIIAALLLFTLFVAASSAGGYVAVRSTATQTCRDREGGLRCQEPAWAKCVAANGLGYCEGIL